MTDGLVVDKSRVTHGQMRELTLMRMAIQRAERDLDVEKAGDLLQKADAIMASLVVAVPEDWLPKGVTLKSPDWLSCVSEEHYQSIVEALGASPGKKTD